MKSLIKRSLMWMFVPLLLSVAVIATAKDGKSDTLPPGLQKKAAAGQPLPPGWEKKLAVGEVLDAEIYRTGTIIVPRTPDGIVTVDVQGKILRVIDNTREIVEILDSL